ncbi:MAG: preprotein translocase subunit SecE [Clostridia bacterium]|nr:preprotein translocase subunit SecE [Clostridia bacterium]
MANNNKRESVGEYFRGVKKELGKVVWPTRKELGAYTVVVLATCVAFGVAFWLIDMGVIALLKNVLNITLN